jgi:predicted P-loop ATPase
MMQNEWIDDLTTNHNPAPLLKQEWMWVLNVKEMESSSKIDLKDVLW